MLWKNATYMKDLAAIMIVTVLMIFWVGCRRADVAPVPPTELIPPPSVELDYAIFDGETPKTIIYAISGGVKTKIATVSGGPTTYTKPEYPTYEVPEEALTACGAWWAGAGDYFYFIPDNEGHIAVYAGWQDELQEDEGFHYELLMTL